MKLYHGTNAAYIPSILANGLTPRGKKNKNSNWENTVVSKAGHVYLSSSYAFYFAHCSVKELETGKAAVLELELTKADEAKLYPDEDFIAQVQDMKAKKESDSLHRPTLIARTQRVKLDDFKQSWPISLQHMGNVSYRGTIPASRIKRIAVIDTKARMDLVMGYGDNIVSVLAYAVMKPTYEGFTNWLFGDNKLLPAGLGGMDLATLEREGGLWAEKAKQVRAQSADRHGIEVREAGAWR